MVCCVIHLKVMSISYITPRASVCSTKRSAYECPFDDVSIHDLTKSYSTMLSICISTVSLALMISDASSQALAHRSCLCVT